MTKKTRIQYIGPSRDIKYNPWMRLVHGEHYMIEKHQTSSGHIRIKIWNGIDVCRESYKSKKEFDAEWL